MKKILMVCMGNICRSPMADGLLRKKILENKLAITVDSAGTGNWHAGEAPDERMQETALKNGLDISQLRARQFKIEDFDQFDRIFVMDENNYKNIVKLAPTANDKKKVDFILNLNYPGEDRNVPDPYYGGKEGFQYVFDLLDKATDILIEELLKNE